ncbi:MAG: hypothetical protein IIA70_02015 [Proteobacteria bacterium]|nr:hypothetical protein [Pseudomonadota bacterium]
MPLSAFAQGEEENAASPAFAERAPGEPMTVERLEAIIRIFDPEAERNLNSFSFKMPVQDMELNIQVITDPAAGRMRIVIPIVMETSLGPERIKRIMQANFDSALDARYALAQGVLWATFIHPLSSLSDEEFLSGLSQTLNLAATYGSTYSSGLFVFGGGDSQGILDRLLEDYRRKLEPEV